MLATQLAAIETFGGVLGLWAIAAVALIALYAATGLALEAMNARHPERRIQSRAPSDRRTDIRQSLLSLLFIAAYVAAGLWLQAQGWGLFSPWDLGLLEVVVGFVVSLVIYDAWFYWAHRLMHTRALYRFHAQHHVSIAPTPWSNNNDTMVGTFFEQSYFLVAPLVLPFPALVFVMHKIWDQVTGMIGHAGHEYFASPIARAPWLGVCTVYHDQHHAQFRCNFANTFTFWDRLCGTLHPTYDASVRRFEGPAGEAPTGQKTGR
ncbi:MAG: sterol desaturase family protein [Pseudomonadota bacterium]